MERMNKAVIFTFLITFTNSVTGLIVPPPDDLVVTLLEREVTVHWKRPAGAPPIPKYNVQMGKYNEDWAAVTSCTNITNTQCDLSGSIHDYHTVYKVRVQLVDGGETSSWVAKKILPNTSEIQPPSFTLMATSTTLTVLVHGRPVLKKMFPFGVIYTFTMEETGNKNKATTAYRRDNSGEDTTIQTFTSLNSNKEYCVSVILEGSGALNSSKASPKQCVLLPENESFVVAVTLLSALCVLGIIAAMTAIIFFHWRISAKTPAALKSPLNAWHPLSVGEAPVEVVTDKGWFLSSAKKEVKECLSPTVVVVQDHRWRTSMDSGVDMESNSSSGNREGHPFRQEDSGCGSMCASESSNSNTLTNQQDNDGGTNAAIERIMEDSVAGCDSQHNAVGTSLQVHEKRVLGYMFTQSPYHRQHVSALQLSAPEPGDTPNQTHGDSTLAKVVMGYRAAPQACVCSGAGQCAWCHSRGPVQAHTIKQQFRVPSVDGVIGDKWVPPYFGKNGIPNSGYAKSPHMNTLGMEDLENTLQHSQGTFPLLASLSTLPVMKERWDLNLSLSLSDLQLQTD